MNRSSTPILATRHRVITGIAIFATIILSAYCASSALASPPSFLHKEFGYRAYSTRVMMEGSPGLVDGGLETEWKAEYSTSCAGPWTEVNHDNTTEHIFIGVEEERIFGGSGKVLRWFRHLTPNTSYCVRFTAKNADGEAAPEVIAFKTLPIEKPEVDKKNQGEFTEDKEIPEFIGSTSSDTTAGFSASIEGNGAETTYTFEYAPAEAGGGRPAEGSASWRPAASGGTGTVSVAEEHAQVSVSLTGLTPETTYYLRLKMRNSAGESVQTEYTGGNASQFEMFTTLPAKPSVSRVEVRNHTSSQARVISRVGPHGSETRWHFEYATSILGPWTPVPGGEGTISQTQAEAMPYSREVYVGGTMTDLSPAEKYFVRLYAENTAGEGIYCKNDSSMDNGIICEPILMQTEGLGMFETTGPPSAASTFAVHGLVGELLQLDGEVDPKDSPTSAEQTITLDDASKGGTFTLTFDGHESAPISYDAPAGEVEGPGSVREALDAIAGNDVSVEGPAGGPYTVAFEGSEGGVSEPQIEANGSALVPSGSVNVVTDFKGGEGAEAKYYFEYVSQAGFAEHGWSDADRTPEELVPVSERSEVVSAMLPALPAGETYRYRILVTSSIAGAGVLEGSEQSLTVPSFTVQPVPSPCPNEAFRTGLSARLPDCRAYEQISPVEKTGSQEPWQYGGELDSNLMVAGEGDDAVLEATSVNWGVGLGAGGSPYLFSREGGHGWGMTGGSPQPETGVDNDRPQVYSENVTQVALEAGYRTAPSDESQTIEYKVGPVGGPYTTVATVPREHAGEQGKEGWVAANGSFSKLVLQTRDHSLLGEPTGTHSGSDLYEDTEQEGLRQLNVTGEPAVTIGSCGASVVDGTLEKTVDGPNDNQVSGPHTISTNGSRVFFEAIPSKNCSESKNLYMRVNGQETVDLGGYKFMGANAQGTTLLVDNAAGELLAYDVEAKATTSQSTDEMESAQELDALGIPDKVEAGEGAESFSHPRYTYWGANTTDAKDDQVYRYDNVEHLVQCVSCASSFDPDPKQPAFVSSGTGAGMKGGAQELSTSSANGEFDFFTTPAALVPQDVDGETGINEGGDISSEYEDVDRATSPSSDVYEWRAAGVDGCAHVQGCLALMTSGRGGYKNMLLRASDEGNDVFIYTRSTLVGQTGRPEGSLGEGNIYDVRVDGGFSPAPPRPTECEADACSTPPSAPNDSTPPSVTFSGSGNVLAAPSTKTVVKGKKTKHKAKPKSKRKTAKKQGKKKQGKRASGKKANGNSGGRGSRSVAGGSTRTDGRTGR